METKLKREVFSGVLLSLRRDSGLTVRDLLSLLETANPDAVVTFDNWQHVRFASLDAKNCHHNHQPIVVLKTE